MEHHTHATGTLQTYAHLKPKEVLPKMKVLQFYKSHTVVLSTSQVDYSFALNPNTLLPIYLLF